MKSFGRVVSIVVVALLGVAILVPSTGTAAKKRKPPVPSLLTYKAMLHVAGGVTLSSVHDDIKNCLPGQYWLMKERSEFDIRGNILVENYKGQTLRTTSAKKPGGIESTHFLASYEESNYCPDDEPIELDKPKCTSYSTTGNASLGTSLYSPRRKQVTLGIARGGGREQENSCTWGLTSSATPAGSQIESMSSIYSSETIPLNFSISQLRTLGVKKSLIRFIHVGGSCAKPRFYAGKKIDAINSLDDGDCVVDGTFAVTVKRLNRATRQGVPVG